MKTFIHDCYFFSCVSLAHSDRDWYWTDRLPVTYTRFESARPLHTETAGRRCVEIDIGTGLWRDTECKHVTGIVCKAPMGEY